MELVCLCLLGTCPKTFVEQDFVCSAIKVFGGEAQNTCLGLNSHHFL